MKKTLILLIFIICLIRENVTEDIDDELNLSYQDFKEKSIKYGPRSFSASGSKNESDFENERKKNLEETKIKIRKHNQLYINGRFSYKLGLNQFSDFSEYDFKRYVKFGISKRSMLVNNAEKFSSSNLNSVFFVNVIAKDWNDLGAITPVKNQGNLCFSCTAFASVGAIESYYSVITGELISFSEQYIVDCGDNDKLCEFGGQIDSIYEFLMNQNGLPKLADYSNVKMITEGKKSDCKKSKDLVEFNITKYNEVDPVDIVKVLGNIGPLSVQIKVDMEDFRHYKGGILDDPKICSDNNPNHAVLLVGYDKNTFKFKNSWGDWWGEK